MVEQKQIGEVIGVQANFGFLAGNVPRLIDPNLGGGALLDIGIYLVSFASIFLGVPSKILATGDLLPSGVDSHASISLHYKENQVASLLYSFKGLLPNNAVVLGTEGYIRIDHTFWTPLKTTLVKQGKEEHFEFTLPGNRFLLKPGINVYRGKIQLYKLFWIILRSKTCTREN